MIHQFLFGTVAYKTWKFNSDNPTFLLLSKQTLSFYDTPHNLYYISWIHIRKKCHKMVYELCKSKFSFQTGMGHSFR